MTDPDDERERQAEREAIQREACTPEELARLGLLDEVEW